MLKKFGQVVGNSRCVNPCVACYEQCDLLHEDKVQNVAIWKIKESAAFLIQDAFIVDEAVDISSNIPTNQMAQAFPHFRELSFPAVEEKKVNLQLKCDLHQTYSSKEVLIGGARISIWIAHRLRVDILWQEWR